MDKRGHATCTHASISVIIANLTGLISAIKKGTTIFPLDCNNVLRRRKMEGFPCRPRVPKITPKTCDVVIMGRPRRCDC